MRLLQINPVLRTSTSTGRIMQEIGELVISQGWESYIAYSGGRDGEHPQCKSHLVPVGNKFDVAWHAVETRLLDRHGLASRRATKDFIRRVQEIQPDIIHIHNIHGYFLNYKILFKFLAEYGRPVVWTVHDCWLFTGHCYHYSSAHCNKWQTQCEKCPQKRLFPASWLMDRSRQNYKDKAYYFNLLGKDKFVICPVSDWMAGEIRSSFLKNCQLRTMHNGINLNVFSPQDNEALIRNIYGITRKYVILAIAAIWLPEKGIEDLVQLASRLNEDEELVMVGVDDKLRSCLPPNIIAISRTANVEQLAGLYSLATALVNPTWQDNYPTINLEAMACGTPVVTYRTGGSPESISEETGFVVEQGDVDGMLQAVRTIEKKGKKYYINTCRSYAEMYFRKEDRYQDYIELYKELT